MSSSTAMAPGRNAARPRQDARRWWALSVIALAQLMVVLDATIMSIALPSAQRDLGLTDGTRQWVVTAYTVAFGGLLLVGGRVADRVGRKRAFVVGLVGFGAASAVGGAAAGPAMLFAARAGQGCFAALLAPSALSLLATTFTDGKERAKAFGVFGALAAAGGGIGLLLGGVLTQYLDWRWCLYVNVAIAAIGVVGAALFLDHRAGHRAAGFDGPGIVLSSSGLVTVVYTVSRAESDGWLSGTVLPLLAGGVVLLAAFTWWQARAASPLLPLRIIASRAHGGPMLTLCLAMVGLFGAFFFLTYYLQNVLGYSALKSGFAFLPMSAFILLTSTQLSARLLAHVAPRLMIAPGLAIASLGMLTFTTLSARSAYATHVLPGAVLIGFGMGLVFMPVMATATAGVAPQDAGVTSAAVSTAQQVGGSIGTALLNTIATSSASHWISTHLAGNGGAQATSAQRQAIVRAGAVHGFTTAFWWAAAIMLAGALAAAFVIDVPSPRRRATT
ncbi:MULTISPECIES: MFS transporter [unclassified Streptomyces]|uniref:MFS transporter n=1 Tax=unclassified Streptomyces TaxID=2593676 RepID=UPI00380390DB